MGKKSKHKAKKQEELAPSAAGGEGKQPEIQEAISSGPEISQESVGAETNDTETPAPEATHPGDERDSESSLPETTARPDAPEPAVASAIGGTAIGTSEPTAGPRPEDQDMPGAPQQETVETKEDAPQPSVQKATRPAEKRRRLMILGIIILTLIGLVVLFAARQNTARTADARLIQSVSNMVVLPDDETPTVSTVVDKTQLDQPFLSDAENGDKVLLYFKAGKAVVYRPSSGKIVNIGPLEIPRAQVFIRDGSPKEVPQDIADRISSSAEFTVASRDVSPRQNYQQTIVVDVAGNRPDVAARLAILLGAKVAPMPAGESRPDADLLVIVGADKD